MATLESSGGLRRQSSGFVFTRVFLDSLADAAIIDEPAEGLLFEPSAFLFTNEVAPTAGSVVADFTVPTWAGYLNVDAMSFGVEPRGVGGIAWQGLELAQWLVGAAPDDFVRGWGIRKGAVLIGAQVLSEPISPVVGEYLTLVAELDLSSN